MSVHSLVAHANVHARSASKRIQCYLDIVVIDRVCPLFITQPLFLFFHESFFASNSSGEVRRNKERKKERDVFAPYFLHI